MAACEPLKQAYHGCCQVDVCAGSALAIGADLLLLLGRLGAELRRLLQLQHGLRHRLLPQLLLQQVVLLLGHQLLLQHRRDAAVQLGARRRCFLLAEEGRAASARGAVQLLKTHSGQFMNMINSRYTARYSKFANYREKHSRPLKTSYRPITQAQII